MRYTTTVLGLFLFALVPNARAAPIANGDFEAGNTGFTTGYTYSPGDIGPAQSYDVVDNPAHARPHDISPISYGDHTSGTGLMMAVNGATTANQLVWSETVSVTPLTHYTFTAWMSSWFASAPEQLDVLFNGTSIGTFTAPSSTAVWSQRTATWDSGLATSATIELRNITTADVGNDFALDDIALNGPAAVPEPGSLLTAAIGIGLLGWAGLRRRWGSAA